MNELYWITRIGAINDCFCVFIVFASFFLIALIINYLVLTSDSYLSEHDLRKLAKTKKG